MDKKIKIVVNKKSPKGIVNFFGNVQNKVGTYDRERLENFKKKLAEKSILVGEKILFYIEIIDDVVVSLTDDFFDRALDSYENHHKKRETVVVDINNLGDYSDDIIEDKPIPVIIPTRRINFEDLEPLGKIIDEEDDVYQLQELKMELLFRKKDDEYSNESDVIRKK